MTDNSSSPAPSKGPTRGEEMTRLTPEELKRATDLLDFAIDSDHTRATIRRVAAALSAQEARHQQEMEQAKQDAKFECYAGLARGTNVLLDKIRARALKAEAREKVLREALEDITLVRCGIPGHSVAVGCAAASIAYAALRPTTSEVDANVKVEGYRSGPAPQEQPLGTGEATNVREQVKPSPRRPPTIAGDEQAPARGDADSSGVTPGLVASPVLAAALPEQETPKPEPVFRGLTADHFHYPGVACPYAECHPAFEPLSRPGGSR